MGHSRLSKETSTSVARKPWFAFVYTGNRVAQEKCLAVLNFPPQSNHKIRPLDRSVNGSLTPYVNRAYEACVTKYPGTAMTICDIPCAVNTPMHTTSFPANTKAGFPVLKFTPSAEIFFITKDLRNVRLQREVLLLWRQQLPVNIVNFLPFWWFSHISIIYLKSSNTLCLPTGSSKPSQTIRKRSKNINKIKKQLPFWLIPLSKTPAHPAAYNTRLEANGRRTGPIKQETETCNISKKGLTTA